MYLLSSVSTNSLYLFTMCCVINLRHTFIHSFILFTCVRAVSTLARAHVRRSEVGIGAITLHLCFWNRASPRARGSPVYLSCLLSELQAPACLFLPSTDLRGACSHAGSLWRWWGPECWSSHLCGKHFTHMSPLPNTKTYIQTRHAFSQGYSVPRQSGLGDCDSTVKI